MANENVEETTQNPEEEETSASLSEEETSEEVQETSTEPAVSQRELEEVRKQNEQLYARLKKTEEKLDKVSKTSQYSSSVLDPEDMSRTLATFEGLDADERTRLIQESRLKDVSIEDARKDEDFALWQQAHKRKVEREKVTSPSTKQGIDTSSPKAKVARFSSGQMSSEEEEKFLIETGIMKDYSKDK
jgi:hypothetical protein